MSESVIGLLLGTEEDWPAAFEALVSRLGPVDGTSSEPSGSSTSRSTCATGPVTRSSSTGSRGGTTCRARG